LISRCARCGRRIRDCTGFVRDGEVLVTVPAWYHTGDGTQTCGGWRAWPVLNVHAACADHGDDPDDRCPACDTSEQVSLFFHNDGRCIAKLCRWAHA
jgi:hypothetical protein